jgi:hypothetical protein
MLAIAVGLLVLDASATCVLVARRRRARRQMAEARLTSQRRDVASVAQALNDDLARRQAILLAQRQMAHQGVSDPSPDDPVGAPRGVASPLVELRRAADLLSAIDVLVYDPMVWED